MSSKLTILHQELGIKTGELAMRNLPFHEESQGLVLAEARDRRQHLLTPQAAEAWRTMKAAAGTAGIEIHIISAFRSMERQAEIIRQKLANGENLETILSVCAPPGYSEHHTGRAVDIGTSGSTPLETEFEDSAAFDWLMAHAQEFGFSLSYPRNNRYGYVYEPWHWCHHGGPNPRQA